jgi:hypothetical protein
VKNDKMKIEKLTQGKRKVLFRTLYIPSNEDADVAAYLIAARDQGQNVTQLITDALKLMIDQEVTK